MFHSIALTQLYDYCLFHYYVISDCPVPVKQPCKIWVNKPKPLKKKKTVNALSAYQWTYSVLPKNKNETKHAALRFVKLEEVLHVFI